MKNKTIYIIAGPNGSGKTTFAKEFVAENKLLFLNADEIALKASPKDIRAARLTAGKEFLRTIEKYVSKGKSFAVETTLAGKYWVPLLKDLKRRRYVIQLIFIFVESEEEALRRIEIRIEKGGHAVPQDDVRRRFGRSKTNFWNVYRKGADNWQLFLNSKDDFLLVAEGSGSRHNIIDEDGFKIFMEGVR